VTYGYTAAGFSGRMPCAEIADAIVSAARATLERAIERVEGNPKWRAKVVYGDTDSLFVLLEGRTKEEAFKLGKEMADDVTRSNPSPVRLQMEKVYLPSMLVAKKRYVGWKWESPTGGSPVLDAKGIEMVRRDGCPALVRIQENCIRSLFAHKDVSLVRRYVEREWSRIYTGDVLVKDFIFAKGRPHISHTHTEHRRRHSTQCPPFSPFPVVPLSVLSLSVQCDSHRLRCAHCGDNSARHR
jgi:DNA polymerase zeta